MNLFALRHVSSRTWLFSLFLAIILAAADFSSRLTLSESSSDTVSALDREVPTLPWPKLSLIQAAIVSEAYSAFDPAPPAVENIEAKPLPTPKPKLPSLAEQVGELKALIMAQQRYELMAVVETDSSEVYALIKSTDLNTKVSKVERFENGAQLNGLVLAIDSLTRVRFSATPELLKREGIETEFEPIVLLMYNR